MDVFKAAIISLVIRWLIKPLMVSCYPTKYSLEPSQPRTNLLALALFTLLLAFSVINPSEASGSRVLIIKSGSAPAYSQIVRTTRQRVNRICRGKPSNCRKPSISVETISDSKRLQSVVKDNNWDLIVTIGTKAANKLNSFNVKTPTLYALIPSHSFPSIRRQSKSRHNSAIYIDQPIRRQLQLIKSSMPNRKKVGVLLGKYTGVKKQHLQRLMHEMGLSPTIIHVTPDSIGKRLNELYSKSKVLLALPDPTVYNKRTVMKVLLSSFRHKVPVIGYSAAFAKSGATTAIYSTPGNIGNQIGDEIERFFSTRKGRLSSPSFPKYFSIKTNRRVINSLKLRMPSSSSIKARIIKAK